MSEPASCLLSMIKQAQASVVSGSSVERPNAGIGLSCAVLIKNTHVIDSILRKSIGFSIIQNRTMPKGIAIVQNYSNKKQMSPEGEYRMVKIEQFRKVPTLEW